MLQAYNILYPYEYGSLKDDEYISAMTSRIDSHQSIIYSNIETGKQGTLILPCIIHDIDNDYFEFRDGLGSPIDTQIIGYNPGSGWVESDMTGPILKTDAVYAYAGKVIYIQYNTEPILYNKTLTGSLSTDGKMFSLSYYDRLEFLYNSRLGCAYIKTDETIVSFDSLTGEMTTDLNSYILEFPSAVKFSVGDTMPGESFIDKAVALTLEPPYVKITLKKEYSYIKKIFTFDSNKIISLID